MILLPVLLAAALAGPPKAAMRQSAGDINFCPCCRVSCTKPWVIPDRWNDGLVIPGHEDWANNGRWDQEPFTDTNGNGYRDAGEPFTDQNGDGQYEEEYYHPINTGYVAWKDAGMELVLKPGSSTGTYAPGHFNAIDMSADGRFDDTGNRYEWDIAHCNPYIVGPGDLVHFHPGNVNGPTQRGVDSLVAQDPSAHWDPVRQDIVSDLPASPRAIFIALGDPRVGISSGRQYMVIAKMTAFFIEGMDANGNVIGRFVRVASPIGGIPCPRGYPPNTAFISTCAP